MKNHISQSKDNGKDITMDNFNHREHKGNNEKNKQNPLIQKSKKL